MSGFLLFVFCIIIITRGFTSFLPAPDSLHWGRGARSWDWPRWGKIVEIILSPVVMLYPLNLYKRCTYVVIAELPGAWHWGRQPEKEVHQRHPHRLKVIPGSHQCEFLTFEAAWFPEISSTILGFAENLFVSDFRGGPLGESKDSVDSVKPVIEKHFSNYLWTFSISTRIQSQRTAQLMDHLFAIMIGEQILICDLEKKLWGEPQ